MMNIPRAAAIMAAALFVANTAAGQVSPVIALTPVEPARWDVAGDVGWFGGNKSDIGAEWDDWYDALSVGVSAGRYLTPHLKTEIHAAMTGEGHIYGADPAFLTGAPMSQASEHYFQTARVGAGLSYQFFENQWFHPFIGGGLEMVREREREVVQQRFVPSPPTRDPTAPFPIVPGPVVIVPAISLPPQVSYAARPFVTTGFKWYVAERAFLRTSVQASLSRRGAAHIVWATGFGADL